MHSFSQYFGIHSVQINFRILYSLRTYQTYTMGRLEMHSFPWHIWIHSVQIYFRILHNLRTLRRGGGFLK